MRSQAPTALSRTRPATPPAPPAAAQPVTAATTAGSSASLSRAGMALGIVALLLATTSWGGMFLVSKQVLQHVDPVWFTLIRYSLSALFFAALLVPRGAAPWRTLRAHALPLALRGLAGFGIFSTLLLFGLAHSLPSHGAIIMATVPMSTQLLRWVLDGMRPARATLLTSVLALVGVVVVSGVFADVFSADAHVGPPTLGGDALALAGSFGWIVYTRGAAKFAALGVVEYTALTALASWPLLLVGALLATALGVAAVPELSALQASWPALLYVGLVSSALAVLAFNLGLRVVGAVSATAFMNMVPISALLMAIAFGKTPSANELIGLAMVVTALLLHTAASRSAYRAGPAQQAEPTPLPAMAALPHKTCGVTQ